MRTAILLSLGYAVLVSLLLIFGRSQLVAIYTNDPAVAAIAINLLLFIAVYQLFDDTQAAMAGACAVTRTPACPLRLLADRLLAAGRTAGLRPRLRL